MVTAPSPSTAEEPQPILAEEDAHVVRNEVGLAKLEALLLGDRDVPVIVLTEAEDLPRPVLAPTRVREVVGSKALIWFLPGEQLPRRLRLRLGRSLAVCRGAVRIFWPGVSQSSAAGAHPLVPVLDGEPEEDALAELSRQFDLSRPSVRVEIEMIEDLRSILQSELSATAADLQHTAQRLRDANIERHVAITRVERLEERLEPAAAPSTASFDELLHVLITREWLRAFVPAARREHPLGAYVLGTDLTAVARARPSFTHERLAWVCAMVACGYARRVSSIAPQPLRAGRRGAQLRRGDGARGWYCDLEADTPLQLRYWIRRDRTVEFAELLELPVDGHR